MNPKVIFSRFQWTRIELSKREMSLVSTFFYSLRGLNGTIIIRGEKGEKAAILGIIKNRKGEKDRWEGRMGSTVPEGEGDDDPKDPFSCFYWWRSLPDFPSPGGGWPRPELIPGKDAALTPRLRVMKEMERLALASHDSLDDLRHRLLTYRAGDLWFSAGGVSKEDTDIPPVITILLLGFAASGKSSLVNLMYSVVGRSVIVPFSQTFTPAGEDGRTVFLEEHNVLRSMRSGFCVFDSRGLDYDHLTEGLEEVSEWMEDGVRHRQMCRGAGNIDGSAASATATRFARRHVNCVMLVVSVSEIHRSIVAGDLTQLNATKELFHANSIRNNCNDKPILVLTHGDELSPEERVEGRVRICEALGLSEAAGVYDVSCLYDQGAVIGDEVDPVTAYALAEGVYRALMEADRYYPPKRGAKDWLALAISWVLWFLSIVFAFLADLCSKFAQRDHRHKLRLQ